MVEDDATVVLIVVAALEVEACVVATVVVTGVGVVRAVVAATVVVDRRLVEGGFAVVDFVVVAASVVGFVLKNPVDVLEAGRAADEDVDATEVDEDGGANDVESAVEPTYEHWLVKAYKFSTQLAQSLMLDVGPVAHVVGQCTVLPTS